MRTWTERYPGRLEHELAEFERRGLEFELDEELLAEQGRVVLRGAIERDGEKISLQVGYPDFFPFIRPEVSAPGLKVPRHQSPFGGNLCLLDRSTRAWKPSYTAAWLVGEKVPYLLDLLDSGEEVMRAAEAPQGEPMTTYFQGTPGTVIFVPDSILKLDPEATGGSGRIACAPFEGPGLWLRGAIAELIEKGPQGKTQTLGRIEEPLRARFGGAEVAFRWARLATLPAAGTPIAVLEAVESARSGFGTPPWESIPGGEIAVSGAVISEEVTQGVYEDAWLFVVQYRNEQQEGRYLIRGDRLGRDELRGPTSLRDPPR